MPRLSKKEYDEFQTWKAAGGFLEKGQSVQIHHEKKQEPALHASGLCQGCKTKAGKARKRCCCKGTKDMSTVVSVTKPPEEQSPPPDLTEGRGANPWLAHVKRFREQHPGMPYRQVLHEAKASYTKVKQPAKKIIKKVVAGGAVTAAAIMEGLEKSGIIKATSATLGALTEKLQAVLDNPGSVRERTLWIDTIPNLQLKYDTIRNKLDANKDRWLPFRVRNHELKLNNIEARIKRAVTQLDRIRQLKP